MGREFSRLARMSVGAIDEAVKQVGRAAKCWEGKRGRDG